MTVTFVARLRSVALAAVLLAGTGFFLAKVGVRTAISDWLVWSYVKCWAAVLFESAACVAAGHALMVRLLRRTLPLHEHLTLSFAAGLYLFFLATFVAGLVGLIVPALFFAVPLGLLAVGAAATLRTGRRLARHVAWRRARGVAPSPRWAPLVLGFGAIALLLIYAVTMSPANMAFDARWYHLTIAEHYVAEGAIRRFPEGWYPGAVPHLASVVYTWAFLLPRSTMFERAELAYHLDFAALAWTLVGVVAMVRRMVPRYRASYAWAVRFLFPGVFLYESALGGAADQFAAIWAAPIYLLVLRAYPVLDPRFLALASMMLAGAFLTKFSGALLLLGFPVAVLAGRAVLFAVRALRGRATHRTWLVGSAVAVASGLALTAPHWLKNVIFYRDPFYPVLHRLITPRPWTPDAADVFEFGFKRGLWVPTRDAAGLLESLRAVLFFSFEPQDWEASAWKVVNFGSLFTLLLFALPFLRSVKRLAGLYLACHVGVFVWYWTHHQDRYLQAMLPWITAATASAMVLVWREGAPRAPVAAAAVAEGRLVRLLGWVRRADPVARAPRAALIVLVAAQLAWSGDIPFVPGKLRHREPLRNTLDLLGSGYLKSRDQRDRPFSQMQAIGAALPKGAKVLLHEERVHLGIGARTVSDLQTLQGGIDYGHLGTPGAAHDLLVSFGVTHLLWAPHSSSANDSYAGDLVFLAYTRPLTATAKTFGGLVLAPVPRERPGEVDDVVAVFGCSGSYRSGLYHLRDLAVPMFGPRKTQLPAPYRPLGSGPDGVSGLLQAAAFAVVERTCKPRGLDALSGFVLGVRRRGDVELWARSSGGEVPPAPSAPAPPDHARGDGPEE